MKRFKTPSFKFKPTENQVKKRGKNQAVTGYTNHMTSDRSLLMDSTLRPSTKSHITFPNTSKSKVLGLGRVAISKDQHMDKVMLVESLGFN